MTGGLLVMVQNQGEYLHYLPVAPGLPEEVLLQPLYCGALADEAIRIARKIHFVDLNDRHFYFERSA